MMSVFDLFSLFSLVTVLLISPPTAAAVRFASKKSGGSSKNHGGKSRGKSYGVKKLEGKPLGFFCSCLGSCL